MTSPALPPSHVEALPAGPSADLLAPILGVGSRDIRVGLGIGVTIAALVHGYVVVRVAVALLSMGEFVREARTEAHAYFWATQEVDTAPEKKKEEAPKPEEPEPPPPEEPPEQVKQKPPEEDIYKEKTAQKAAAPPDLVTAKENGQQPEDFDGVYDHDGSQGPITGLVDPKGKGTDRVDPNQKTKIDGDPKGNGGGEKTTAPPKVDRSKPATLAGSSEWSCPFPAEADAEGKDSAVATIVVTVKPDGSPASISVIADPGSGFGRAARRCALGRRYEPGLDKDGQKTTATTPPIRVKFRR